MREEEEDAQRRRMCFPYLSHTPSGEEAKNCGNYLKGEGGTFSMKGRGELH